MVLSDGSVRNAWTVKLKNMENRPRPMVLAFKDLSGAVMWTDAMAEQDAARSVHAKVDADAIRPLRIYVKAPAGTAQQHFAFILKALDREGGGDMERARFDAPEAEGETGQ
jgi:hypothetical protein